jgi:hypothetical protein
MKQFLLIALTFSFLVSACGAGALFNPTKTSTPRNTPTLKFTSTSTPTATPTVTPLPTPTLLSLGSDEFLYLVNDTHELYSSERGILIGRTQLKSLLPKEIFSDYYLDPSPDGKIIFVHLESEPDSQMPLYYLGHHYYIISTDLGEVIPLDMHGEIIKWLNWSSDGLKLAIEGIVGDWDTIYMFDQDGNKLKPFIQGAWEPFWNFDNSKIYYRYWDKPLSVRNIDGSGDKPIPLNLNMPGLRNIEKIEFSPDGSKVVFNGYDIQNNGTSFSDYSRYFYLANSDFSNPGKILEYETDDYFIGVLSIIWSPDMNLVLINLEGFENSSLQSYFPLYQFLININDKQIVPIPSPEGTKFSGWSPDMKLIAYIDNKTLFLADAKNYNYKQEIIVDTKGKGPTFWSLGLTPLDGCPVWVVK